MVRKLVQARSKRPCRERERESEREGRERKLVGRCHKGVRLSEGCREQSADIIPTRPTESRYFDSAKTVLTRSLEIQWTTKNKNPGRTCELLFSVIPPQYPTRCSIFLIMIIIRESEKAFFGSLCKPGSTHESAPLTVLRYTECVLMNSHSLPCPLFQLFICSVNPDPFTRCQNALILGWSPLLWFKRVSSQLKLNIALPPSAGL